MDKQKAAKRRVVFYHANGEEEVSNGSDCHVAIITAVHSETCVNLYVIPDLGEPHFRTSVMLADEPGQPGRWSWEEPGSEVQEAA